ncbi:McrC family protein [Sulfurimonas sp.]|uniref:McrC family protein n=1 Tax=Sulfurimonas sp. TaxID=2022749 RepID=UPI002B46810B|nr:restriction endonuclease [Sulfurimonas sp.]
MLENIIYEYEEIPRDLNKYIQVNESLHQYFRQDWQKVKATQYCGILNHGDKDYYILPKIANHDSKKNLNIFIYMLMYVYDVKLLNEQTASSENEPHEILEVFIQMFIQNLFKEFQKGIYKEYITEQDNLTTLRGKYLINENLKYNFTKNKIYCEYDEFSQNNELNQFFLYAIKTLIKFAKNKKLLKQCELILDEVDAKSFDINKINIHFNRLNSRYKDSFEFAILLLNKFVPTFENGKKSFAFLFDMNVLFEKFIGRIYKEIDATTELQNERNFGSLKLRPDIIIKSKNLIIDCKYKVIKNDKIASREDRYQMYVYANNFENIDATMLLYPKHLDEIDKTIVLGENDNKVELQMKSVDLDFYGGYYEYIEEIRNRLEKII